MEQISCGETWTAENYRGSIKIGIPQFVRENLTRDTKSLTLYSPKIRKEAEMIRRS